MRALRAEEEALLQDGARAQQALLRGARARGGAGTLLRPGARVGARARSGPAVAARVGEAASVPSLEPLSRAVALPLYQGGGYSGRIQSSIEFSSQFLRFG